MTGMKEGKCYTKDGHWIPLWERLEGKSLSPKEIVVLQLTADGMTAGEIGFKLDRSPDTVKNQKYFIYKKLGARSAAHAAAIGVRKGIIK